MDHHDDDTYSNRNLSRFTGAKASERSCETCLSENSRLSPNVAFYFRKTLRLDSQWSMVKTYTSDVICFSGEVTKISLYLTFGWSKSHQRVEKLKILENDLPQRDVASNSPPQGTRLWSRKKRHFRISPSMFSLLSFSADSVRVSMLLFLLFLHSANAIYQAKWNEIENVCSENYFFFRRAFLSLIAVHLHLYFEIQQATWSLFRSLTSRGSAHRRIESNSESSLNETVLHTRITVSCCSMVAFDSLELTTQKTKTEKHNANIASCFFFFCVLEQEIYKILNKEVASCDIKMLRLCMWLTIRDITFVMIMRNAIKRLTFACYDP